MHYGAGMAAHTDEPTRFVIVPKVSHPWYDEVLRGAQGQAEAMSGALRRPIDVTCLAPAEATVREQDAAVAAALDSGAAGIAVDPVESIDHIPAISRARERGIPVVVFDSPAPQVGVTGIGNDFAEQGAIAARRLATLLDGTGEVAVMQGVPHAPNHVERYRAQLEVLQEFPGITVVDGGADHDDIERATREAADVLQAHPDLRGYLACDASGPIGIARAVVAAGRVGAVQVVGMDSIAPIAQAVADGVLESSVATIPRMQGALAVLTLWQASLGLPVPRFVDTGIDIVTVENVATFLR